MCIYIYIYIPITFSAIVNVMATDSVYRKAANEFVITNIISTLLASRLRFDVYYQQCQVSQVPAASTENL